jgi:hypothetical protein
MRTTVMLPPELLRAAKARAARQDETLKALMTRAIEKELGPPQQGTRAEWPLIRNRHKQKRRLTNADLEDILIAEGVKRLRLKPR